MLKTEEIPVILCDVKLPDINCVELVHKMRQIHLYCEIINLTDYGNVSEGIKVMKNSAFDYGRLPGKDPPSFCKSNGQGTASKKGAVFRKKIEKSFRVSVNNLDF